MSSSESSCNARMPSPAPNGGLKEAPAWGIPSHYSDSSTWSKDIQEIASLWLVSDLLTPWAHLHILHSATSLLLANLEHRAVSESLLPKYLALAQAISMHFRAVRCKFEP